VWCIQFPQKRAAAPKRAREASHSSSSSSSSTKAAPAAAAAITAVPTSQALVTAITGGAHWRTASLLPPPTKQPRMVMASPSGFGHQENQFLSTYQVAFSYFFAVESDIRGNDGVSGF
jgi:hypothetical protein